MPKRPSPPKRRNLVALALILNPRRSPKRHTNKKKTQNKRACRGRITPTKD